MGLVRIKGGIREKGGVSVDVSVLVRTGLLPDGRFDAPLNRQRFPLSATSARSRLGISSRIKITKNTLEHSHQYCFITPLAIMNTTPFPRWIIFWYHQQMRPLPCSFILQAQTRMNSHKYDLLTYNGGHWRRVMSDISVFKSKSF